MTTTPPSKTKKGKTHQSDLASSFIQKSFQLLEEQKFTDIVDWNAEGTAIVIKEPIAFGQTVLPTYFRHNNLNSFVRQLNMYDFRKRRTQAYDHVYYHDLFQRGKKHLLVGIKRKNQGSSLGNIQKVLEALKKLENDPKLEANEDLNEGSLFKKLSKDALTKLGSLEYKVKRLDSQDSEETQPEQGKRFCENQLLKKLNSEAFSKIESLERMVKELTNQNQALWNQINHQSKKESLLVSFVSEIMEKKGVSSDKLTRMLNNQTNLAALSLPEEVSTAKRSIRAPEKENANMNVEDFLSFKDTSSHSTELPSCSSHMKPAFDFNDAYGEEMSFEAKGQKYQATHQQLLSKRGLSSDRNEFESYGKALKVENGTTTTDLAAPCDSSLRIYKRESSYGMRFEGFMQSFADADGSLNDNFDFLI